MKPKRKNVWGLIKQAINDIEIRNNIKFGNTAWDRIKQLEEEILSLQREQIEEIRADYERKS